MYEVPHGHIVVRPEAAKAVTEGGLFIPEMGKQAPPKGECVLIADPDFSEFLDADPIVVLEGDTVHYKPYSGFEIPLLMPGTPNPWRCITCGARDSEFGLPKLCPRNADTLTGAFGPHEFVEGAPEPETYLILDLRDVLLVERAPKTTEYVPISADVSDIVAAPV